MDLIKRLFGSAAKPELATPSQLDAQPSSKPMEMDSEAATRRELVRVVTRDTMIDTGVPEGWIETHILIELVRAGQTFIHLRLVVKHWDARLLKYAVAFQRRLLREIEGFDPAARDWLLSITWQYAVDDMCPFLEMPEPSTWTQPIPKAVPKDGSRQPTAPRPRDELQEDLALLFAVRDADLAKPKPPSAPIVPDIIL